MNRKRFLAGGAGLTAASLLPGVPSPAQAAATSSGNALLPPERIGIQLYSVSDAISEQGFAKVLPELAAIGYKLVEFAGYTDSTGISVKDLRKLLDDNGLKAIGSHVSPNSEDSMKQILADAAVLGIPNVGISLPLPSQGPTAAGWKALSQEYNGYGEMAAKENVGFYLHNHFHEWFQTPDDPSKRGEDILLAECDPRYVFFEMDIYWAHVGQSQGLDAFDPLTDYAIPHKERYRLFHVKDGVANEFGHAVPFNGITDAGQGSIDFKRFFTELFKVSPPDQHHYIWERDNASDHPRGSLASARSSFVYIRHGLTTGAAGPGAAASVPAAVTSVAFRGRKLRVTIEADEEITAKLAVRRGRRVLARRKRAKLAAGRHVLTLPLPRAAAGGPARLHATFTTAAGTAHRTRLPVRVPAG
jgi:sugar phosphate isomerase/epimerase